jgi:hypothetical protein
MASNPPTSAPASPWVILSTGPEGSYRFASSHGTKILALEWILERRVAGEATEFVIFSADSVHQMVVTNTVAWEAAPPAQG